VFETNSATVLQLLVGDGVASFIGYLYDLTTSLGSTGETCFDREWFFKSNAVENVIREIKRTKIESICRPAVFTLVVVNHCWKTRLVA